MKAEAGNRIAFRSTPDYEYTLFKRDNHLCIRTLGGGSVQVIIEVTGKRPASRYRGAYRCKITIKVANRLNEEVLGLIW